MQLSCITILFAQTGVEHLLQNRPRARIAGRDRPTVLRVPFATRDNDVQCRGPFTCTPTGQHGGRVTKPQVRPQQFRPLSTAWRVIWP